VCSLLHGLWARSGMLPRSCSITIWIIPGRDHVARHALPGEMPKGTRAAFLGVQCF